ncbi:MAG: cysteine desulfurase-like protein, partial [Acidobacteria bacterium]|nr:cysteine desulfurase-like protein [Acidobacteriota bacterium]
VHRAGALVFLDAVGDYLANTNANAGGVFSTSVESDALLREARLAVADLLGTADPELVVFGANMTTLTIKLARSLARGWRPGDRILVCRSEHDANFTPWILAARGAGVDVVEIGLRGDEGSLDLEQLSHALSSRTRLVAVGCASNLLGTVQPIQEIVETVHRAGALVFLDAVHYAPHRLLDVEGWNCDFLACSAYKFFGPHVGVLWGRRECLESLAVDKLRPVPDDLPESWMTGTANQEGIAGTGAAVEYLAALGGSLCDRRVVGRRESLEIAYRAIADWEEGLSRRLLAGLSELESIRVWGVTDVDRMRDRVATFSFQHARLSPQQVSAHLAERGIFTWHGNFYALPATEALGLEPEGVVRVGLLHYNTAGEVDRFLGALAELC